MLKKRYVFNPKMAMICAVVMAGFGVGGLVLTSAATAPSGSIKISTYVYENGNVTPIGGVTVTVQSVGGAQKCTSNAGTTPQGGDRSVTLTSCDVANDGGEKKYQLAAPPTRAGYTFRSLHVNNTGMDIGAGNVFPVRKGTTTSLAVWMDKTPDAPAPAAPAPAPAANKELETGDIKVSTYAFKDGEVTPIGSVKVSVKSVGGAQKCAENTKTVLADGDRSTTFEKCQIAADGGAKVYELDPLPEREGYTFRSLRINKGGEQTVSEDRRFSVTKEGVSLAIWMTPPENFKPVTPTPEAKAPSNPAGKKDGTIEVTSYVFENNAVTRQANVKVKVDSIGTDNSASVSCDQREKTTDASSKASPNYAQATFSNCWTASTGKKQYRLEEVTLPVGFNFSSFRISGDKFASGKDVSTDLKEQFEVKSGAGEKTSLAIWMTKVDLPPEVAAQAKAQATAAAAASGQPVVASGVGLVRQVVTASGVKYVAAKENPASKILAKLLNQTISVKLLDPEELEGDDLDGSDEEEFDDFEEDDADADYEGEEPATPPSAPTDFKATQDPSGAIILGWNAAKGNPEGEELNYYVERIDSTTLEKKSFEPIEGTRLVDATKLTYPHTYTYQVHAQDEEDNVSSTVSAEITTTPLVVNVPAQAADPVQLARADSGAQTLSLSVQIPAGASTVPLACSVGEVAVETDMTAGLGTVIGSPIGLSCREEDGDPVDDLDDDAIFDAELEGIEDEDVEIYAYDGEDYQKIEFGEDGKPVNSPDGSTIEYSNATRSKVKGKNTTKIKLASKKSMQIMAVKRESPSAGSRLALILPVTLGSIIIAVAAGLYIQKRREQLLAKGYSPYGDVDLMPIAPQPHQPEQIIRPTYQPPEDER